MEERNHTNALQVTVNNFMPMQVVQTTGDTKQLKMINERQCVCAVDVTLTSSR